MCYAAPGPRCSNHARKAVDTARRAYENASAKHAYYSNARGAVETDVQVQKSAEILEEARTSYKKAVAEYDSTPAGQKELRELIDADTKVSMPSEKTKKYASRLKRGEQTRKEQLKAYKKENPKATLEDEDSSFSIQSGSQGAVEAPTEAPTMPSEPVNFLDQEKFRNVKKMPALFVIDRENNVTTQDINAKAAWLFSEPARATIKRDGTSITVDENGKVWARRSVKKGKTAPENYILAETDPVTGHSFGLEPVEQSGYAKMFKQAAGNQTFTPGTYELCGPKVNGNPESLETHQLLSHGEDIATEIPDMRTLPREQAFDTLRGIFKDYKKRGIEGVVWHGSDGKRVKLRVKDFFGDPNRR